MDTQGVHVVVPPAADFGRTEPPSGQDVPETEPLSEPPSAGGAPHSTPTAGPDRRRRWIAVAAAAALVVSAVLAGVGITATTRSSGTSPAVGASTPGGATSPPSTSTGGAGPTPSRSAPSARQSATTTTATAAQQVGVVDITTVLGMAGGEAAATGMVLTSGGEILTNNHVVNGATSVSVRVVSTGRTYAATVVGYDPTQDVGVIQLVGASGLQTVTASTATATIGERVVGVGNAGGTGGTPTAASGVVTALDQRITASEEGSAPETLTGLIETDAPIAAGDSGGPLYDVYGHVIAMDTAGAVNGPTAAYAIPISRALAVAATIESGRASSTVHIGATAFIGIEVASGTSTLVVGVLDGSPAAAAGLVAGDTITSLAGHQVTTSASMTSIMQELRPGHPVSVLWIDLYGHSHAGSITPIAGPAH